MARDIFGNKTKLRKEKDYHFRTSEWDITKEQIKIVIWIALGMGYLYFIVL
jgi:hypothetical protein